MTIKDIKEVFAGDTNVVDIEVHYAPRFRDRNRESARECIGTDYEGIFIYPTHEVNWDELEAYRYEVLEREEYDGIFMGESDRCFEDYYPDAGEDAKVVIVWLTHRAYALLTDAEHPAVGEILSKEEGQYQRCLVLRPRREHPSDDIYEEEYYSAADDDDYYDESSEYVEEDCFGLRSDYDLVVDDPHDLQYHLAANYALLSEEGFEDIVHKIYCDDPDDAWWEDMDEGKIFQECFGSADAKILAIVLL